MNDPAYYLRTYAVASARWLGGGDACTCAVTEPMWPLGIATIIGAPAMHRGCGKLIPAARLGPDELPWKAGVDAAGKEPEAGGDDRNRVRLLQEGEQGGDGEQDDRHDEQGFGHERMVPRWPATEPDDLGRIVGPDAHTFIVDRLAHADGAPPPKG